MPSSKGTSRRTGPNRWGMSRAMSWADRVRRAQALLPLGVAVGFFFVASLIIIKGGPPFPYRLGQTVSGKQIVARVPVLDPEKLRNLRRVAELNAENHYALNEAMLKGVEAALTNLREKAAANETLEALRAELAKQNQKWDLDENAFAALRKLATEKEATGFKELMTRMMAAARAEPLVRQLSLEDRSPTSAAQIAILRGHDTPTIARDRLKYVTNSEHVQSVINTVVKRAPSALQDALAAKWREVLQPGPDPREYVPIYEFDKKATDEAIKAARDRVVLERAAKPAGAPICEPGILIERDLEALRIEHREYLEALDAQEGFWTLSLRRGMGLGGIVLLVTIGLCLYVWWYGAESARGPRQLLASAVTMLLMLLLVRLGALANWPPELAVVPVVMTGAILTIAFDQRFAFAVTSGLAILAILAIGGDFGLLLVLMTSMGVTVFTLEEIRTRSKVLDVGGLTAVAAFVVSACVGLIEGQTSQFAGQCALTAAASGLAAGFLIFGILPLIERVFDVTTALTLLEWGSMHQPLLRRLREEAPGTYSHSQTLGDMAERAAEAIGANGLLARTGAYFHDVGKIVKPNYFVENYEMKVDQHKNLQPTMSTLIIVGHVRDGLDLASQYGVPRLLRSFIAEHHGTTLVEYFYREAATRQTAEGNPEPSESEFRYPGPKPQSKETAILMLCDSVEGAVRAYQERTAGRIEATVHQIAMKRLMDGQLDECNMTLKDLRRVEDSLTRSLISVYHGRIAYPKGKRAEGEAFKAKEAGSAG